MKPKKKKKSLLFPFPKILPLLRETRRSHIPMVLLPPGLSSPIYRAPAPAPLRQPGSSSRGSAAILVSTCTGPRSGKSTRGWLSLPPLPLMCCYDVVPVFTMLLIQARTPHMPDKCYARERHSGPLISLFFMSSITMYITQD